ncbi:MAG: LPXTG cell wall anchor domain-containing protein [Candidatus Ornithomonoglobus sp.]
MKKVYLCAAAAGVMTATIASQAFAASNCSVTAKSASKTITLTYPSGSYTEYTQDADNLFKGLSAASANSYTEDTLTITSNSKAGISVDVALKLTIDSAPETEYSPLDYYSFIISDNNGNIVYSSEEEEPSDVSDTVKYIYLGQFNSQFTSDTVSYDVQYKVSDAGKSLGKDDIAGLGLELAAEPLQITAENSGSSATAAEAAQTAPAAEENAAEAPADASETPESAEPEETPAPTEKVEKTIIIGESKDKDGNVITEGRYTMKGNAVVTIKDKDGKLKTEETVIDGSVEGVEGVSQLIVTLDDGDVITITPIEGQTKAPISLEKTNISPVTKAEAASNATENPNVPASSKSSPKTGDNGMALGMLGGLMAAAAAGFGCLGIAKRRKSN